jgi:tRNA threonylcarbamoyl adenosine modification protein YeaZ
MQKQQLGAGYFFAIQATYEGLELAIGTNNDTIHTVSLHKFEASRMILIALEQLLTLHTITLSNIHCIIVNQGPGPFTTLRTVLATVNGLAYATGIPLVGVDGIATLARQTPGITVALLNAFNKDVYYAIAHDTIILETGCQSGTLLIHTLHEHYPQTPITFVGNGADLFQGDLHATFGPHALISLPIAHTPSIEQIVTQGLQQWHEHYNVTPQLMPLYLKQHSAAIKHP